MTIDDRILERLSRYLDGDLDPAEVEVVTARLETDRELQSELSALRRVRRSLAGLANREHPPAELDALIEPLLRGRPTPLMARPWPRFLAAAAVIVLGVTVVFEINHKEPESRTDFRPSVQEGIRQTAAGSPESAAEASPPPSPKGERPRGAVDRLLASPDPEIAPLDEDLPALEVIGPLEDAEFDAQQTTSRAKDSTDALRPEPTDLVSRRSTHEEADKELGADSAEQLSEGGPLTDQGPEDQQLDNSTARAKLYVFMEDETAWQDFDPGIQSESGRYALRIRVVGGIVREVWPVGKPPAAPSQHLRAGEVIVGLKIAGVPDGEYSAEVMVEPHAIHRR